MTDTRKDTRTVEDEVQIAAPVESVWRALTEADELSNWFPLEASVKPGEGGAIWLSWGDLAEWDHKIRIWEPNKRLKMTSSYEKPAPVEIAVDFHLEPREGGTVLRVVHSGFGADAEWDTEYFGVKLGWRYELQSLQHYLEKHPGVERKVVWAKTALEVTSEQAWEILLGADGFTAEGSLAGLKPGDRYSIKNAAGQVFTGVVKTISPPMEFSGTVETLGDSLLRIAFEHGSPVPVALIWLATYGLSKSQMDELRASFQSMLSGLFGKGS